MKNLPIGISTLKSIREENMVYIDKTDHALNLIRTKGRFFLSRPRRFGKSLFVDTLKEIFEGNKELFQELYIFDKWNWEKKYPVIKIDFASGGVKNNTELSVRIKYILNANGENNDIILSKNTDIAGIFTDLIKEMTKKYQSPIVILVDEYDKPLLDNIDNYSAAMEIREGLKAFYSVIKEQDANIQFAMLTGVSKFSKVNIFSGINNLKDITLDSNYATICGYTQENLETSFGDHLENVDWNKLKTWYNGYNFLGESVYNPFDILLFISENQKYKNYWFETGTPSFLMKLFQKRKYFLPDLSNLEVGEELISSFDIESIEPATLLFQSGYLTIEKMFTRRDRILFRLKYPNEEVKISFNEHLITCYTDYTIEKENFENNTYNAMMQGDFKALEATIKRLFAGISYRNFTNNDLLEFEGYYASVLYAFFSAINCEVIPEDITNKGQADMTIKLGDYIYVMEIKVIAQEPVLSPEDTSKNTALRQIQERGYAEKYRGTDSKKVFEVGMIFSQEKRNLVVFGWE